MKKKILWDYNGVILDDAQACYHADLKVTLHFGGRHFTFDEWQRNIRIPSMGFYADFGCPFMGLSDDEFMQTAIEVGQVFHRAYEPLADERGARSGLLETIIFAKARDIECVIFSNHTTPEICKQLERLHLANFYAAVFGNADKKTSHLAQTKRGRIAQYLGENYDPSEALIIGDSPEEVQIGKEFRITTVAITDGYYDMKRLKKSDPNHLIGRVDQLIPILEGKL